MSSGYVSLVIHHDNFLPNLHSQISGPHQSAIGKEKIIVFNHNLNAQSGIDLKGQYYIVT